MQQNSLFRTDTYVSVLIDYGNYYALGDYTVTAIYVSPDTILSIPTR